jgi:hypothetical protein
MGVFPIIQFASFGRSVGIPQELVPSPIGTLIV